MYVHDKFEAIWKENVRCKCTFTFTVPLLGEKLCLWKNTFFKIFSNLCIKDISQFTAVPLIDRLTVATVFPLTTVQYILPVKQFLVIKIYSPIHWPYLLVDIYKSLFIDCTWYCQILLWVTTIDTRKNTNITRDSVGWACVAHLSFCFEET